MSQHDYILADAAGAAFRADANLALAAIVSRNSGATAPATTYAYMLWADTTAGVLKRRNAANSAWIIECTLDEAFVLSRSSNTILDESDRGKVLIATAGFTQTLTAAATLGDGWGVDIIVDSGATLVIDPNSTETVDGATTKSIVGPAQGRLVCNGTLFRTIGFVAAAGITLGTSVASTSGTSIDFTSIASNVKRITINVSGLSTNGSDPLRIQIGDSGGVETSGYLSSSFSGATAINDTSGFAVRFTGAANVINGTMTLTLIDAATNTWAFSHAMGHSDTAASIVGGGSKALSATLDRVRITTTGGTNTFDAGLINITTETSA